MNFDDKMYKRGHEDGVVSAKVDLDRLARLCEAKDTEITQQNAVAANYQQLYYSAVDKSKQQLSEAQAQIAMQAEALRELAECSPCQNGCAIDDMTCATNLANAALSATSKTVAAWRAKEIEPLRQAEKLAIQKELEQTHARYEAEEKLEPLRREVTMLRDGASRMLVSPYCGTGIEFIQAMKQLERAITDTQATALAYEQEVENRGAVKALERIIRGGCDLDFIEAVLEELRAAK